MEKKPTLLVIDDDNAICRFVAAIAGKEYDVSIADSRDGAAPLLQNSFDILLMDGQMPGMSADEFLPRLRQICPNTKVVLISGWYDSTEAERLGIHHFLGKPFTADQLLSLLKDLSVRSGEHNSVHVG